MPHGSSKNQVAHFCRAYRPQVRLQNGRIDSLVRLRTWVLLAAWILALVPPAGAVIVRQSVVTASVSERSCTIPKPAAVFQPTQRQAFLWFVARQVRAGDQLRVDWIDPSGAISTTPAYRELPTPSAPRFTPHLPIAGLSPPP